MKHVDLKHPPTHRGDLGSVAWELDLEHLRKVNSSTNEDCTVAAWVMRVSWAHPFWAYYCIVVIHLRPVTGVKPPRMYLPDATHEVWCMALDPDREPDLDNPIKTRLSPMNFVGQWNVNTRLNPVDQDRAAQLKIAEVVQLILNGKMNPDTDGIAKWVEMFGGHCLK